MLRCIVIFAVAIYFLCLAGPTLPLPHPPATTAAPVIAARTSYDTKFDNVDLDEVLSRDRLLRNYVRCLEGIGPCTPDGKMLRETLPDAILNNCAKCSKKQKLGSEKVTHFLIDNRPEDWTRLEKIYDPQSVYRQAYLAQKAKENNTPDSSQAESTKV